MAAWILAPALVKLRDEINKKWPLRDKTSDGSLGNAAHSASKSDHNPAKVKWSSTPVVHAIDVDEDLTGSANKVYPKFNSGQAAKAALVDYLLARCRSGKEKRIWYIIYERKIYSKSNGWVAKNYTGANAHDHHVHFSIDYAYAQSNATSFFPDDAPVYLKPSTEFNGGIMVLDDLLKDIEAKAKSELVKRLQQALVHYGFSVGSAGADGWWGTNTKNAVSKAQVILCGAAPDSAGSNGIPGQTLLDNLGFSEPVVEKVANTYEVRPGDGLYKIANIHGITLPELVEVNPEWKDDIEKPLWVGTVLKLPANAKPTPEPEEEETDIPEIQDEPEVEVKANFTVLTLNTRLSSSKESKPELQWPGRKKMLLKLITDYKPTIIGTQENSDDIREDMLKALGGDYTVYHHAKVGIMYDASKVRLLKSYQFNLDNEDEADRRYCVVQFQHIESGKKFWVGNTHMGVNFDGADKERIEQAKEILGHNDKIGFDEGIVMGDFNDDKMSPDIGVRTTFQRPKGVTKGALYDLRWSLKQDKTKYKNFDHNTVHYFKKVTKTKKWIDDILTTDKIKVLKAETISTDLDSKYPNATDHNGVIAWLEF